LILTAGFFVYLGWIFIFSQNEKIRQVSLFGPSGQAEKTAKITEKENEETFGSKDIKLEAKAAYVFDVLKNQPLFELNPDVQLPLASVAKIMTALVAAENLPSYILVTIPQEAILQEGDDGFLSGEQWPIADLIDAMLVSSSNDAAFSLAFEYDKNFSGNFVSLMNQRAQDLQLAQTYFLNPTGLDFSKNTAGAYGSAKDIANLLLYILKNRFSLMEATRFDEIEINQRKFKNTDYLVNDLAGFMAGKTGYSDLAGGNLAIVLDKGYGHPIIIVVLGSNFEGRFRDAKNLYEAVIARKIDL